MSQTQEWAQALKISAPQLAEWNALAPDGVPLVVWLLQEGHISVQSYLSWAQEKYQLPILKSSGFTQKFVEEHLLREKSESYSPWFFPVEKWDDVTLVACVEPPEAPAKQHRYILADPSHMREVWSRAAHGATESSPTTDLPPLPEVPDGLKIKPTPEIFKINLDRLELNPTVNSEETRIVKSTLPPPAPPIPPPPSDNTEKISSSGSGVVVPTVSKVLQIAQAIDARNAVHPRSREGLTATKSTAEKQEIKRLFASILQHYDHAFIMRCHGQEALLYDWDDKLAPLEGGAHSKIDLAYPTFMRIVAKTGLPYHGFLVDSPAHQELFKSLGLKQNPACVTAVPVRHEDNLLGIVVAIGGENLQNLQSLRIMETATESLKSMLTRNWSKAA